MIDNWVAVRGHKGGGRTDGQAMDGQTDGGGERERERVSEKKRRARRKRTTDMTVHQSVPQPLTAD